MNSDRILTYVVCGLLMALGILFAVKPLVMWRFTESWKPGSEDGPQPGYLRFARTFGIILAVVGAGLLVFSLMSAAGGT